MTNGSWVAMSALVGLMATSAAQANSITIDADLYTPGTDVSTVFSGVTLSHLTFSAAGMQVGSVYAAGCTPGAAVCTALGAASFGWQDANGVIQPSWYSSSSLIGNCLSQLYPYCYNLSSIPQSLLEVALDAPTDFIQFDSTYGTDMPYVWALDAAGNILTSVTKTVTIIYRPGPRPPYNHQRVTVTSSLDNIARIVIAGNAGFSTVNTITFNAP